MFQAHIISCDVQKNPAYETIMKDFLIGFNFLEDLGEIQEHCQKFLSVFNKMGGPFAKAGDMIKKHMKRSCDENGFDIKFDSD